MFLTVVNVYVYEFNTVGCFWNGKGVSCISRVGWGVLTVVNVYVYVIQGVVF